ALVHEPRELAAVELDRPANSRQRTTREDERRLVAVRPAEPLRLEAQRGFVGLRPHDVTVDRREERLDLARIHALAVREVVRGLEPVDAAVRARDEAVEARRHVDRHARGGSRHRRASRRAYVSSRRVWSLLDGFDASLAKALEVIAHLLEPL